MKRVVITGLGCISPLGNNVETMWAELLKGSCAIDYIHSLDATELPVKIAAEVKDFRPEDFDIDRAIDIWNPRCPASYREAVKAEYEKAKGELWQ